MIGLNGSTNRFFAYGFIAIFAVLMITACGGESASQQDHDDAVFVGEKLFNTNCSVCHGISAVGTNQGPPLIDKTYHPNHHPDFSFQNAIKNGVRRHHWDFGNMLPVAGVSEDDAEKIICYIRDTQLANGIFETDEYESTC